MILPPSSQPESIVPSKGIPLEEESLDGFWLLILADRKVLFKREKMPLSSRFSRDSLIFDASFYRHV